MTVVPRKSLQPDAYNCSSPPYPLLHAHWGYVRSTPLVQTRTNIHSNNCLLKIKVTLKQKGTRVLSRSCPRPHCATCIRHLNLEQGVGEGNSAF